MIRINLLPTDFETPQSPINPAIPFGACVLLPLIVMVPWHLKQKSLQKQLQIEKTQKQQELEKLQAVIRQVQDLENAKKALNDRKGVIRQLEADRLRYPRFMEDCVRLLPGNLWLTGLSTITPATGNTLNVNFDFVALDNYAIADLVSNLENSQLFTNVELGTLSTSQSQTGGQTISFRLTAVYTKTEVPIDASKKS